MPQKEFQDIKYNIQNIFMIKTNNAKQKHRKAKNNNHETFNIKTRHGKTSQAKNKQTPYNIKYNSRIIKKTKKLT